MHGLAAFNNGSIPNINTCVLQDKPVLMDFTVMQHLERYVEQDTPFKIT